MHNARFRLAPLGYGDARRLLSIMGGARVPGEWLGGLRGLEYR